MNADTDEGALHILTGPMFSGKTTELLRYLADASKANLRCLYINHSLDDRTENEFSTHNPLLKKTFGEDVNIDTLSVTSLFEAEDDIEKYNVIGIDEAQFYKDLVKVIDWVNEHNKNVIVAGLNANFMRGKFGQVRKLLCQADSCKILTAFCTECGSKGKITKAIHTKRITSSEQIIDIGAGSKYSALCRKCYNISVST